MTEGSTQPADSTAVAHCDACGHLVGNNATFCGECGRQLTAEEPLTEPLPPREVPAGHAGSGAPVASQTPEPPRAPPDPAAGPPPWATAGPRPGAPPAWGPQPQAGWAQQTGSWPTQPGYGTPPPPPPSGYLAPYASAYPAPPERKTSNGLIVGLAVAAIVAAGLVVAVVLLAVNSSSQTPTITTTATQAAANIKPVAPSASTAVQTSGAGRGAAGNLFNTGKHTQSSPIASSSQTAATRSTPPASPTANIADASGARGVVQDHWARIASGDYTGAYALLAPGVGGTDESSWVANHQQEHPQVLAAVFGAPTFNSPTGATVPIVSLKTSASDGCKTWTGNYGVTKQNGQWTISSANLSQGPSC